VHFALSSDPTAVRAVTLPPRAQLAPGTSFLLVGDLGQTETSADTVARALAAAFDGGGGGAAAGEGKEEARAGSGGAEEEDTAADDSSSSSSVAPRVVGALILGDLSYADCDQARSHNTYTHTHTHTHTGACLTNEHAQSSRLSPPRRSF
jgi:hypothetical protein